MKALLGDTPLRGICARPPASFIWLQSALRVVLIVGLLMIAACRMGGRQNSLTEPGPGPDASTESQSGAGESVDPQTENVGDLKLESPMAGLKPSHQESRAVSYYYFAVAQRVLSDGQLKEGVWLLEKAVAEDPDSSFLKLELAEILAADQQEGRALWLIEQVLAQDPAFPPALVLAGKIHQQRQDTRKAAALFEKALAVDPHNQNVYVVLGRLYWNENDLPNAQRIFQQMVDNLAGDSAGHFFLGKVLSAQGELDAAVAAFKQALALDANMVEPRLELIDIYKSRQQGALAIELYHDILSNDPDNINVTLDLAVYQHQLGKSADADTLLIQLGKQSSSDNRIVALVFEKFLENKQYANAVWVLERMLEGAPSSSELHYLSGVAYDGMENPLAALDHLERVEVGSRFYPNAVVHRALLYYNAGQIEAAIAAIRQAIVDLPENADLHYYLASFYEEQERYAEAIEVLESGLTGHMDNVQLSFKLGIVLDKTGRRQESIEAMKRVVNIDPDHADALNYLGYTYAEMGIHLDEAEQLIRSALKNKPENGYITDSMGWVYYKKGEYQKALEWLHRALNLVPDDPSILEHVGDVYLKLNQRDQALNYFNRSLEANPQNRESLKAKIHSLLKSSEGSLSVGDRPQPQ